MPQLNYAPEARLRAQREEEARRLAEQRSAFAELGGLVQNPDPTYEDMVPVNRATKIASTEGRLAGLAEFLRGGLQMRGGMGPIELPLQKYLRIARGIAKNPSDVEDIAQTMNMAAVKRIATKGATGPEAEHVARGAGKNWRPADTQAIGARREDVRAIEKMTAKLGPVGHDKLAAALAEENPKAGWSVKRVQDVLANKRQAEVRLDKLTKTERGVLEGRELKDVEANPEQIASIRERVRQLSPAAQRDAIALMSGEKDASELHPQTLARIRAAMSEWNPEKNTPAPTQSGTIVSRQGQPAKIPPKTETPIKDAEALIVEEPKVAQRSKGFKSRPIQLKPKEISGGAPVPEDMPEGLIPEFGTHNFRDVLSNQPRQFRSQSNAGMPGFYPDASGRQFGRVGAPQPGEAAGKLRAQVYEMVDKVRENERLLAETGASGRLGPTTVPESQMHTMGPVPVADAWNRLRNAIKNIGWLQSNN